MQHKSTFLYTSHFYHFNVEKHEGHRSEKGEIERFSNDLFYCCVNARSSFHLKCWKHQLILFYSVTQILMTETPHNIQQNNGLFHLFYTLCCYKSNDRKTGRVTSLPSPLPVYSLLSILATDKKHLLILELHADAWCPIRSSIFFPCSLLVFSLSVSAAAEKASLLLKSTNICILICMQITMTVTKAHSSDLGLILLCIPMVSWAFAV